ncbi:hypothetical protein GMO_10260 [Gluconobacter morbifer G707]|uniref:Uncharacterized protein n=1 Tax=Gluconobacter morbifer G707 TaxID=1088869 RepID=G6XIT0_9PROT|nr:hypothetical protein GMO_10260 [Gluconobacter morbifer G707]
MGYAPRKTNGGHVCWTHPCGALVFGSSTPGDHRNEQNLLALMRRKLRQSAAASAS